MMDKKTCIEHLSSVTPDNATAIYRIVKPYFETGGKWQLAPEMLKYINTYVWEQLSEGMQNNFRTLSAPTVASSLNDSKEDLSRALRDQVTDCFGDGFVSQDKEGKLIYFRHCEETNTLSTLVKGGGEVIPVLVRDFIKWQDGNGGALSFGQGGTLVNQSDGNIKHSVEHYLSRVRDIGGEPNVWSVDPDIEAFGRPLIEPDESIEFPHIKKFFDRLSDSEAVAGWIWGVYKNLYTGRRVPWIKGEAEDQKSLIFNTIFKELFGNAFVSCGSQDEKAKDKFFSSTFEYAKLAMIPDCANKKMIMREWLKSMTGGDNIRIENKFEAATSKPLESNVFIMSNYLPEFDSRANSTSRALPVLLSKGDKVFTEDLVNKVIDEVPGFLSYAEKCWLKLAETNYKLTLNSTTYRLIEEATQREEEKLYTFFNTYYELDDESSVTATDIRDNISIEKMRNQYFFENFINYLEYKYGIVGKHEDAVFMFKGFKPLTYNNGNLSNKVVDIKKNKGNSDLDEIVNLLS